MKKRNKKIPWTKVNTAERKLILRTCIEKQEALLEDAKRNNPLKRWDIEEQLNILNVKLSKLG